MVAELVPHSSSTIAPAGSNELATRAKKKIAARVRSLCQRRFNGRNEAVVLRRERKRVRDAREFATRASPLCAYVYILCGYAVPEAFLFYFLF